MNSLVSICIPTYQRPKLLGVAIDSALAQTYGEIEIVICDDSQDDKTELMVRDRYAGPRIRYYRNHPSLGQAGNVNRLFELAQGDRLVLLHDDDVLMPSAVSDLAACWQTMPDLVAAYGKQGIIDMDGRENTVASHSLNAGYHRAQQHSGLQPNALWSALVAQFPNDGYLITTQAARNIQYRAIPEVGDICDYDFGLRLAERYGRFFFLNKYTAKYRVTTVAISRKNNHAHLSFDLVAALALEADLEPTRKMRLHNYAPAAVTKWLTLGDKKRAAQIYYSDDYPLAKHLSPKGIFQFLLILAPPPLARKVMHAVLQH